MAERKQHSRPRVRPKSGFEHLYTKGVATDQTAASKRVGMLDVQWDRMLPPSRYTQERAFRIFARHAGVLQRELGPAFAIYLVPTYDEKQEGEE